MRSFGVERFVFSEGLLGGLPEEVPLGANGRRDGGVLPAPALDHVVVRVRRTGRLTK
jgi:hypothetical protein